MEFKPTGGEEATGTQVGGAGGKRQRTRSPSYPYLDLRVALDKAALLWRAEGRHSISVSLAMQHWGYKADSSTGYSCIAALKKFGLVDEEGTGENRAVRLSRLGLAILLDEDAASPERNAALKQAALGPRIHAELWEKYGPELPSDSALRRFLVIEKNFNDAAVEEFLEEYKATISFASLAANNGASATVAALPRSGSPPPAQAGARGSTSKVMAAGPGGSSRGNDRRAQQAPDAGQRPIVAGRTASETGFLFPVPEVAAIAPALPPTTPLDRPLISTGRRPADATSATERQQPELTVPLENGLVVRVPYPLSEEDFTLLLETLHLWKKRLVRAPAK